MVQEYNEATRAAGGVVSTAIVMAAAVDIPRACKQYVAKLNIHQFSLETDPLNLMLTKFFRYTIVYT